MRTLCTFCCVQTATTLNQAVPQQTFMKGTSRFDREKFRAAAAAEQRQHMHVLAQPCTSPAHGLPPVLPLTPQTLLQRGPHQVQHPTRSSQHDAIKPRHTQIKPTTCTPNLQPATATKTSGLCRWAETHRFLCCLPCGQPWQEAPAGARTSLPTLALLHVPAAGCCCCCHLPADSLQDDAAPKIHLCDCHFEG
jgi:hypothetical protein